MTQTIQQQRQHIYNIQIKGPGVGSKLKSSTTNLGFLLRGPICLAQPYRKESCEPGCCPSKHEIQAAASSHLFAELKAEGRGKDVRHGC